MTDVTGFGLAGHLAEMLRASGRGARLDLDAVPALHGALDLLEAGQRATLHEANRAATVIEGLPDSPRGGAAVRSADRRGPAGCPARSPGRRHAGSGCTRPGFRRQSSARSPKRRASPFAERTGDKRRQPVCQIVERGRGQVVGHQRPLDAAFVAARWRA
jgi:hypothetical protein